MILKTVLLKKLCEISLLFNIFLIHFYCFIPSSISPLCNLKSASTQTLIFFHTHFNKTNSFLELKTWQNSHRLNCLEVWQTVEPDAQNLINRIQIGGGGHFIIEPAFVWLLRIWMCVFMVTCNGVFLPHIWYSWDKLWNHSNTDQVGYLNFKYPISRFVLNTSQPQL